jgi:plasmid stabilization system protein ParE
MSFVVSLLWRAQRDLDHIVTWLAERSPQGSAVWLEKWDEIVESLKQSADRCPLAPENDDHDLEIRHVIFKTRHGRPYRALFTMRADHVFVMHIRGPGQDTVQPDHIATTD